MCLWQVVMRTIISILFPLLVANAALAANDTISSSVLENVVVVSDVYRSYLKPRNNGKTIEWNMQVMHRLPKILGNADPVRHLQLLPGVQTNSEYDAGLHVQGCDNMHNMVAIGGVPVYNAAHLLGLFSVFTPSHYPAMSFSKSLGECMVSGRLGAELNMDLPRALPDSINGEFSAGLISSQGTLRMPINRKSALFVSLRTSYLNLLYGPLLSFDDYSLKYGFSDMNITYLYAPDKCNRVWLDVYAGYDDASILETSSSKVVAKWNNWLSAIHHEYQSETFRFRHSLYTTNYNNSFSALRPELRFSMPSSIHDLGYSASLAGNGWNTGLSAVVHSIKPQSTTSVTESEVVEHISPAGCSNEFMLHGNGVLPITDKFCVEASANAILYLSPFSEHYSSLNPSVVAAYATPAFGRLSFAWDIRHQYVLQTGIPATGLPLEYRISSGNGLRPQHSQNYSIVYERDILDGKYRLSCDIYYKKLYNLIEYDGNIYDFYSKTFELENALVTSNGENYGASLMINKCSGSLTGWLSFAVGRSMRRSPLYGPSMYPSNHERLYELNSVATYEFNDRLDFGVTFVAASGTPFTAPKRFYIVNGNLISEYNEHNANRLPSYVRMDLSLNYTFYRDKGVERGVNFSIYNALAASNKIYYRLKFYEGKYAYRGMGFLMRILPSVSYYCKF